MNYSLLNLLDYNYPLLKLLNILNNELLTAQTYCLELLMTDYINYSVVKYQLLATQATFDFFLFWNSYRRSGSRGPT